MAVRGEAPPFARTIPALFEALLDVFVPFDIALAIDDDFERIARIDPVRAFNHEPLWCDEELTREPLTRCKPESGADVVVELWERLAGRSIQTITLEAEGALLHRTDVRAWYGRWCATELRPVATVRFAWPAHGFTFDCPHAGYPLTSTRLLARTIGDGDPAIAEENREAILPAFCRVREALGFDRDEVEWRNDGDYGRTYRDDRTDIWKRWLPRLRAS